MGCSASSVGALDVNDDSNNNAAAKSSQATKPDSKSSRVTASADTDSKPPNAVSFNVGLGSHGGIDSIISKHPPKRLKRLEPLANAPVLTPEMLEKKLRKAEEKRHKHIEKKVEISRRSSRLHQGIQQARELDKVHNQAQEMEDKLRAAELAKEAKKKENEEKKRKREERAKLARERAQKIKKEAEDGVDFDMEKDEAFNADDDDSWLDGENNDRLQRTTNHDDSAVSLGERIYSGRESPHKPRLERRAPMSASTTDSFDYAFQHQDKTRDDFFDS